MSLSFTWDPGKASENLKKHDVSFEEARTVFFDEEAIEFFDEDHSAGEDRFLLLGAECPCSFTSDLPLLPGKRRGHSNHIGPEGYEGRIEALSESLR